MSTKMRLFEFALLSHFSYFIPPLTHPLQKAAYVSLVNVVMELESIRAPWDHNDEDGSRLPVIEI